MKYIHSFVRLLCISIALAVVAIPRLFHYTESCNEDAAHLDISFGIGSLSYWLFVLLVATGKLQCSVGAFFGIGLVLMLISLLSIELLASLPASHHEESGFFLFAHYIFAVIGLLFFFFGWLNNDLEALFPTSLGRGFIYQILCLIFVLLPIFPMIRARKHWSQLEESNPQSVA